MTDRRRVVVTGIGAVSPLGSNATETWEGLTAARNGIEQITLFDITEDYPCQIAGEVKDFDPSAVISSKDQRKMDRFIQLGLVATDEAMRQAGFPDLESIPDDERERFGVALGSGIGGFPLIEKTYDVLKEKGPRRVSPFFIPGILVNLLSGHASIRYGLYGPNLSHVSACATSSHAIGEAGEMIRRGIADVMVAGGAESTICQLAVAGFSALRALSTSCNDTPDTACRPFDKDRDGFVMGEGAGVLVLEEYEHARKRGATILAELSGYGLSSDGHHLTMPVPDGRGAISAMKMALNDGSINPEDVGYVNAHATSTPAGDETESQAIEKVFGRKVLVSATKSMTGHLLGAAGGLEAAISILALQKGVVPPTRNLDTPSEGCTLDYVAHTAREVKVQAALSNSFGFGGTNAALVFKKI